MNDDVLYASSLKRGMRFRLRDEEPDAPVYSVFDYIFEYEYNGDPGDGGHTQYLILNEKTGKIEQRILPDQEIVNFLGFNETDMRDLKR